MGAAFLALVAVTSLGMLAVQIPLAEFQRELTGSARMPEEHPSRLKHGTMTHQPFEVS
jgi:hypothetical protein